MSEMPMRAERGVSLVELVVVVVIVAVLAAVAYPGYQQYARDSRRADAQAALADAATRQEQFFLDNKSYTTVLGAGGLNIAATTNGGHYTLAVDAPTAGCPITGCYSLRATPQGTQSADTCGQLTLDQQGLKTPSDCW